MNELTQFIDFIKELGGFHIVDNIVYYKKVILEFNYSRHFTRGIGPITISCYKDIYQPVTKELYYYGMTEIRHKFLEEFSVFCN